MIDTFTVQQFAQALPKGNKNQIDWVEMFKEGEYTFLTEVKPGIFIQVRSSVHQDGLSADLGKDSIRAWLVGQDGQPLGSKVQKWVTRQPGWQERLIVMLRQLWGMALKIKPCPKCGQLKGVYKVKKEGKNKGRIFTNCKSCKGQFEWV